MKIGNGKQSLHDGGVGGEDDVVLVLSERVISFRFQDTDYLEGDLIEAYDFPERVFPVGKKIFNNGFSYDTYLCRALYIGFGKHTAVIDFKLAYIEVVYAYAGNRRRVVVVPADELSRRRYVGADG